MPSTLLLQSIRRWKRHDKANPERANLHHAGGFTSTELVLVVAIGSLLMIGIASMLITQIQTSAKMHAGMRLQEAWSRIQFLLDQEIQEARSGSDTPAAGDCSSLTINIPNPTTSSEATIVYSRSGTALTRTGPPINADGTLNFATTSSTATVMSGVTSFCPTISNSQVTYTMQLTDPSGATYQNQSQPSGARGQARIIE